MTLRLSCGVLASLSFGALAGYPLGHSSLWFGFLVFIIILTSLSPAEGMESLANSPTNLWQLPYPEDD